MLFTRINNLIGWVVFLIAAAVYIMTAEAGGGDGGSWGVGLAYG